ncbi:MAG: AMP-binding protein [Betaproteobacteria bacterium]|nr:AMP-binding protein [Betaproteobacteria bacterium]
MLHRSPFADVTIPDIPLHELVLARFDAFGERPAIVDAPSGRTLTYARLRDDVTRLAGALTTRGLRKGDVFAVCSPNVPEYATAFLGVTRAGGTVTTMNPLYTVEEIAHQLEETGAGFLLTVPALAERCVEAARGTSVREIFTIGDATGTTSFDTLLAEAGPAPAIAFRPREDLAALPYSSGTSGLPKGVMLTHGNLVAQLCQANAVLARSEEDVAIAVLPFYHIYGMVLILLHGLRNGATLVSMPRFDFVQFLECVQKYRVNNAPLVPPIVLGLAKHPAVDDYDLSSLRQIGCGAAPLGAEVERACSERLGCSVMQGYGMTEFAGASITNREGTDSVRTGSVGQCWPNMEARLVDPATGGDVGVNERGELWMRGPNVMKGYFKRPDATREMLLPDGWLRTGDVARVDEDGNFYIVDRVKELIKHNGYQVAPAELEAVLLRHPAIADAAVIPSPDEETGEVPKAFVVLKSPVEPSAILDFVAGHVAPYKKIRLIEVVESIPKSPSGKILRRELVERERSRADSADAA